MPTEASPIEGYQFIEKLGSGSFGEVWRAEDLKENRVVAIKILRLDRQEPEYLALFKSEFKILSQLKHVNLACVYDFGFSPQAGIYYFSSEYCQGSTLLQAIENKPLPFFEEVLLQILSALDYIHSQGVIHLDLKPENILVDEIEGKPLVKILDFGVAAKIRQVRSGRGGSPAYTAPELFLPTPQFDFRADLYSLGMVSLIAMTGQLPFDTSNPQAATQWHLKGELPESIWEGREIPPYLREVTEKLLAKKPSERFSNARIVMNFFNLATGRKFRAMEESFQPRIPDEGPLVERREGVLDEIERRISVILSLDQTGEPLSSVCFLSGERGIGKSRILSEIRQKIELEEIPFFQIACDEQTPSWPKIASGLNLTSPGIEVTNQEGPTLGRIHRLVEKAKEKPLCLLIDDFQKSDQDFKNLIFELAERTREAHTGGEEIPLFVAVATEELEEKIKAEIRLPRLTLNGVQQYVKLLFGESERIDTVAKLLHQYSGGLPLLMVEGLRFLAPHFYRGEPLENLLPPPEIGLLYRDKVSLLSAEEEELLLILALLLRSATPRELASILGQDLGKVFELSQNGIQLGLIHEDSSSPSDPKPLQTSSQALSLSLAQGLPPEKKKELHHKIAQGLKGVAGTPLTEIAYHFGKGGEEEKAVQCYQEASESLKKEGQIAPAADCLVKGIPLSQKGSPTWEKLTLEASRLLIQSGAYREAEQHLAALESNPSVEQEELRGWLNFKQRKFEAAREHYQKAIDMLSDELKLNRILLFNALGNIDLQERRFEEAASHFKKTLEWEKELEEQDQPKVHSNKLGVALTMLGDREDALTFYKERMKRLELYPNEEEERNLLNGMAYVYLQLSRYEEAIATLKKGMRLAERSGAMHSLFSMMGNLTAALIKEGRYAESLPILQKMVARQRRLGSTRDLAYNLLREGNVYLTLGMIEAAETRFKSGEELALKVKETTLAPWFTLMLGYVERERNNFEEARSFFKKVEGEAAEAKNEDLASWTTYALADLAFEAGRIEECKKILDQIKTDTQDKEFETRLHLLRAKCDASLKKIDPAPLFSAVEAVCLKEKFQEILWEVYYAWGQASWRIQGPEVARDYFEKGIKILQKISRPLPEEYRDRYLKQRNRKMLFEAYQESLAPTKKGFGSRMHSLLKGKIGGIFGKR